MRVEISRAAHRFVVQRDDRVYVWGTSARLGLKNLRVTLSAPPDVEAFSEYQVNGVNVLIERAVDRELKAKDRKWLKVVLWRLPQRLGVSLDPGD